MKILNLSIRLLMVLLLVPLFAFAFYFFHGSLEEFPTDEDHEKVRTVSGVLIAILVFAEAMLFLVVRKIRGRKLD